MAAHVEITRQGKRDFLGLRTPTVSLGRGSENDIVISELSVSRLHALLECRPGGWCVRDLGSRNGTYVNGDRVHTERALRDRDEIRVGSAHLIYRQDPEQALYAETTEQEPPPFLTRRERDVLLALFQCGSTNEMFVEPASTRKIAESLVVSEAAVKQHLMRLYEKFDIGIDGEPRRLRLANEALRRGAVKVSEIRGGAG
jgi:DNA-binding CsgD family transcriptional regulator